MKAVGNDACSHVCGEDCPVFPPGCMADCGNFDAFSMVLCLVLLGYLDPYHSYIESTSHSLIKIQQRQFTYSGSLFGGSVTLSVPRRRRSLEFIHSHHRWF